MLNTLKWLIGFIFIVLQCRNNSSECVFSSEKIFYVRCSHENLTYLPKDIDERVEVFNLTNITGMSWTEEQFKKFPRLKELVLRNVNFSGKYSFEFLSVLRNLEILNLTKIKLPYPPLQLPTSITHLYLDYVNESTGLNESSIRNLSLNELFNLNEISIRGNNLSDLPILHRSAPVTFIDMRENVIKYLKYIDIAHFCQLKKFMVGNYHSKGNQSYIHRCCFMKTWMIVFNISSDLKCESDCPKEKYSKFSSDVVEIHEKCFDRVDIEYSDKFQLMFNLCLTLAVILLLTYFAFMMYRSKFPKVTHEPEIAMPASEEQQDAEPHVEEENTT